LPHRGLGKKSGPSRSAKCFKWLEAAVEIISDFIIALVSNA